MKNAGNIVTIALLAMTSVLAVQSAAGGAIYSDVVLNQGPSAYWRMNETAFAGAGDAPDATAAANDGTYTNTGSITLAQAGPRPGDGFDGFEADNYAPLFASSGNVTMPAGFMPAGNAARTFTGWFNGTSSSSQNWLNYGQYLPSIYGARVSITAGPNRVAVAIAGHNFGVDGLGLSAGWHHVGIMLPGGAGTDSDDWQFVIDGVDRTADATDIAGGAQPIDTLDNNPDRRIGANTGGRIDEMAVFDRALSVEEVRTQFQAAQGNQFSLFDFEFQTAARNGESPATSGVSGLPSGTELFVRERGNDNDPFQEVRAFLKFDTSVLDGITFTQAILKLHEFDKLNDNIEELYIAQVTEDWDPTTNKPTFDQLVDAGSEFSFGNNGVGGRAQDIDFEIDVTDIVRQWQADPSSNYGFRLRIDDYFVAAAFDHTGPLAPELLIRIPEPASVVLLMLAGLCLASFRCRRK